MTDPNAPQPPPEGQAVQPELQPQQVYQPAYTPQTGVPQVHQPHFAPHGTDQQAFQGQPPGQYQSTGESQYYQYEPQSAYAYSPNTYAPYYPGAPGPEIPEKPKKSGLIWLVIVIVILLLGGGGAAAYFFVVKTEATPTTASPAPSPTRPTGRPTGPPTGFPGGQGYTSGLGFTVTFPQGWSAKLDGNTETFSSADKDEKFAVIQVVDHGSKAIEPEAFLNELTKNLQNVQGYRVEQPTQKITYAGLPAARARFGTQQNGYQVVVEVYALKTQSGRLFQIQYAGTTEYFVSHLQEFQQFESTFRPVTAQPGE